MKEITVRISAALVAQVLTQGHMVAPVTVQKGLPPGSRLVGIAFLDGAPAGSEADRVACTFRAPGFPEGAQETLSVEMKFMRGFRNAHAAAPDLLEALKLQGMDYPDGQLCFCGMALSNPMVKDHAPHCIQARAAIAKAETR